METESPPVLEPSQLITDREGLIRLATGIDQGCRRAFFWLFRLLGSRGRRVSLLLEHCDGWNM